MNITSLIPYYDRCASALDAFQENHNKNLVAYNFIEELANFYEGTALESTIFFEHLKTLSMLGINVDRFTMKVETISPSSGNLVIRINGSIPEAIPDGIGTYVYNEVGDPVIVLDRMKVQALASTISESWEVDFEDMLDDMEESLLISQACSEVCAAGMNSTVNYGPVIQMWGQTSIDAIQSIMSSLAVNGSGGSPEAALASISTVFSELAEESVNAETGAWEATMFDNAVQHGFWKGAWTMVSGALGAAMDIAIAFGGMVVKVVGIVGNLALSIASNIYTALTDIPGPTIGEGEDSMYACMGDYDYSDLYGLVQDELTICSMPMAILALVKNTKTRQMRLRVCLRSHANASWSWAKGYSYGVSYLTVLPMSPDFINGFIGQSPTEVLSSSIAESMMGLYRGWSDVSGFDWSYDGGSVDAALQSKARINVNYWISLYDFYNIVRYNPIFRAPEYPGSITQGMLDNINSRSIPFPEVRINQIKPSFATGYQPLSLFLNNPGLFYDITTDRTSLENLADDQILMTAIETLFDWIFENPTNVGMSKFELISFFFSKGYGLNLDGYSVIHHSLTNAWTPKYTPPVRSIKSYIVGCAMQGVLLVSAGVIAFKAYRKIKTVTFKHKNRRQAKLLKAQSEYNANPSEDNMWKLVKANNKYQKTLSKTTANVLPANLLSDSAYATGNTSIGTPVIEEMIKEVKSLVSAVRHLIDGSGTLT